MREVGQRFAQVRQDGFGLAACMQVAGNLVQIAAGLAKVAEYLTQRSTVGRDAPLRAGTGFADERRNCSAGGVAFALQRVAS